MLSRCNFDQEKLVDKIMLINKLDPDFFSDNSEHWHYRKPKEMVEIKGRLSMDMSLFYSAQDVQNLFNWKRPEYQNICRLASQQYLGYSSLAYDSLLELLMGI